MVDLEHGVAADGDRLHVDLGRQCGDDGEIPLADGGRVAHGGLQRRDESPRPLAEEVQPTDGLAVHQLLRPLPADYAHDADVDQAGNASGGEREVYDV